MKRWAVVSTLMFALITGVATAALAAEIKLMGQEDSPAATGTATIEGNRLVVTAEGLKPKAVYTVWLVNMHPTMTKAGAGTAPYSFQADRQGHGKYTAEFSEPPLGKWQVLFIVRHTTGDPKDMERIADALMGKLM